MRTWKAAAGTSLLALGLVCAHAQVSDYGQKEAGPVRDEAPQLLKKVAIIQKLNTQIPLNLAFRDENGKAVHLGDYFGQRPAILGLVYYQCKMLCPEEIDSLVGSLEMVKLDRKSVV